VQYKPREFQNRNKIRTREGSIWLSVPVVTKGLGRQKIMDVKIDNSVDWRAEHLKSIRSCYGRAEFFGRYFPFFEELYAKSWSGLSDLNIAIIEYMVKEMSIETGIYFESRLGIESKKTDRIIEICGKLKAGIYLSGSGGRDYLEEEKFAASGIRLEYQEFAHPGYRQQFMKDAGDFIPYMSALDLLFNEGPRSREILNSAGR
jgi:hypothetical protein